MNWIYPFMQDFRSKSHHITPTRATEHPGLIEEV